MALRTFTAAGDNLWSNAANWDVPPVDNDTIQCAAGPQTIDYDGDMSNAAVWPNGVQLLVGAGGTYTFNMLAGSYFRQAAATVSDISIYCGTVGVEFPFASKATWNSNGFTVGAGGFPFMQIFCAQPAIRYIALSANEAAGQTVLSVDTDVSADPQWIAGATLAIVDITTTRDIEPLVLVSTSAVGPTITVTGGAGAGGGLVAAKSTGARIYLEDRNIRFINAPAAGAFTTIRSVPPSYIRASVTGCNRGTATNVVPSLLGFTDTTKNWTVNALIGCRVVNITDSSTALITANTATTVTANTGTNWDLADVYVIFEAAPTATLFRTCTLCTFDGVAMTKLIAGNTVAFLTSPTCICSGIYIGAPGTAATSTAVATGDYGFNLTSTGIITSNFAGSGGMVSNPLAGSLQDIKLDGELWGQTISLVSNVNNITSAGGKFTTGVIALSDCSGVYLDTCTFTNCTTALKQCARVIACNCTTTGGTTDLDTVAGEFFNCVFGSATEHANYNQLQAWMFTGSEQHDGAAGAYAGWSRGGVCVSNVVTVPPGYTRSIQHLYESATLWNLRQYHVVVQPGAKLTVSAWLRKDLNIATAGNRPTVQIVDVMNDPLVAVANVALASATMTDAVNAWENLSINWTNPNTYQMNVLVRILSRDVGGGPNYFYENASITFYGGGMTPGCGDIIDCT